MKTFRKPKKSEWQARPEWEKDIGVQIEGNATDKVVKTQKDAVQTKKRIFTDMAKF